MDANEALRELVEVSEDVRTAVVFEAGGNQIASTADDGVEIAEVADAMLAYAHSLRGEDAAVARLEAATERGSVFLVRDGERAVVAVTGPEPVSGLVFHDLRAFLRTAREQPRQRARAAS